MALDSYHHGVRVIEINDGIRPIRSISTAVIGLVATASDADAATFPLDKPTLITNVNVALGKAGQRGTLARALDAISSQSSPVIVAVRVADGEGQSADDQAADQVSKIIGGTLATGQYTGMKALLAAQTQLGVKPRILGVPGHDSKEVTTALVAIAQKLRAFVYAGTAGAATVADAIAYRRSFGARELMLLHPEFTRWDAASNATASVSPVAYALGLRAKIDQEIGWHKTLSNMPINGVTGLSRDIYWDLQEPSTDAGLLNENQVTALINAQGFRFWGSRTCTEDPLFAFESATRTAQVLADSIAEAHFWAVDKPLHPSLVKDLLDGVNAKFRGLKSAGYILDGSAWYDETINSSSTLKSGKLVIDYDYTPIPPVEDLTFRQRITDRYFADFASRINA